jgi:hypothetical protein
MTEEPAQGQVRDVALALTVLAFRAGWRAGGVVVRVFRPVGVVCPNRWPCRPLAEAGARYRRAAVAAAARRYRTVVRVVSADVADELDLPRLVRAALTESSEGVRGQARRADRAVSRWVDRTLGR